MKISVIGTINKDLILPFQGASIQSIGGIYYSISALSYLGGDEVEIYPVSYLGNDLYSPFLALLKQHPNISTAGLIPIEQMNHKVILEYTSPEERVEKALFNLPPLKWKQLEPVLACDFFIVNLITGWDVSREAYLRLSEIHYSRMYLDVHFLVMGVDDLGRRFARVPEDIFDWLHGARFVQMNLREFRLITGGTSTELNFFDRHFRPDQVLLITMGSKGTRVIYKQGEIIRNRQFPAYPVEQVVDATGCGDVFGAAFVLKYLQTGRIEKAVEFANLAGAINCMLKGTNEMDKLPGLMEELSSIGKEK